jgi:hypothetical protein
MVEVTAAGKFYQVTCLPGHSSKLKITVIEAGGVAQVVKPLPSKPETLSSNSSTKKKIVNHFRKKNGLA